MFDVVIIFPEVLVYFIPAVSFGFAYKRHNLVLNKMLSFFGNSSVPYVYKKNAKLLLRQRNKLI